MPVTLKRWMKTALRTLHLLAITGVGGGILFGLDPDAWMAYWWLALSSGALLMLIDIAGNPLWLVQIRGVAILIKLLLIALLGTWPAWNKTILVITVVISVVISHAPGKVRYYSLWHRRVIDSRGDTKG